MALLNSRGEVETANQRLGTMLGLGPIHTDVVWLNLSDYLVPPEKERFLHLLRDHEEDPQGTSSQALEFSLNLPGLGPRLFKLYCNWIQETGQICVLFEDFTEQKVLERRMAQKEKAALLESLVGGIAHELNNKLSPILGFADLLVTQSGEGANPAEVAEYCATIRSSALESARIIRQLLQLSRPSAPEWVRTELSELVPDALSVLRFKLKETEVRVRFDPCPEGTPVLVDPGQFKQVLLNLAMNAMDAMEGAERRELSISTVREGGNAVLRVADTGHGIPPTHLTRIFDPFFTTKAPDRGTGLGLSVCYSIVKQHGGEIFAESDRGQGALFKIVLPLALAPAPAVVRPGTAPVTRLVQPRTASLPRAQILVVDDEEYITGLVQHVLRSKLSCRVEGVHNAERAMALLSETSFDLVISDVRMPGVNGVAFFQWVQAHRPALVSRFLFVTGDLGASGLRGEIDTMGVPVLSKPFSVEQLLTECRRLLPQTEPSIGSAAA